MKTQPSVRKSPPKRRGAKKATSISVHSEKQITAMVVRFNLQGPVLTFRDLRQKLNAKYGLNMSIGTVYRLAHGWEPKKVELRRALGLPVLLPVLACECGEVHLSKRCPNKPRPPAKPRVKWKALYLAAVAELERLRLDLSDAKVALGEPNR